MPDNGHAEEKYVPDVLTLTLDRRTMLLEMGGNVIERKKSDPRMFDLIWAMLNQALHHIDVEFRIAAGFEAQMAQKQAQEEFVRMQRLMGKM